MLGQVSRTADSRAAGDPPRWAILGVLSMIVPTSLGLLHPAFPSSQHTAVVGIWL
jgi:hypothetical protein